MASIGGDCAEGFGPVADAFRQNFDDRGEVGAACAVVVGGELVVDLWGGHRDKKRRLPWQSDTLVTVFSTTKGMAAAAMAVAHSRELFELDQPVATYWPEFAAAGRVDPKGRSISQFFADEVADVLGVEFYIGLPDSISQHERIASFIGGTFIGAALRPHLVPWPVLKGLMNPFGDTFKAFTNPKALTKAEDVNKRSLLELELPSVNGTGTARAVATVYGDLASGGNRLGVGQDTLREIEARVDPGLDHIFGIESAFAFGFMKQFPLLSFGSSPRAFGHTGVGGSFGYADPDKDLGYCYVMNKAGYAVPEDEREVALRRAVTACL